MNVRSEPKATDAALRENVLKVSQRVCQSLSLAVRVFAIYEGSAIRVRSTGTVGAYESAMLVSSDGRTA